ncbi:hypothetical protein BJ741DRAFT_631761 [Chytriomyces cf. hyalinus JEL632]|nr:hypothetical protein BJ741DRAFT_631761 [Chytriomyces cf. hyalinus JEL632]
MNSNEAFITNELAHPHSEPEEARNHCRQHAVRTVDTPSPQTVARADAHNPPRANAAQEVSSDFQSMIFTWRIWLGVHLTALVAMISANTYALFIDVAPCDVGIWTFTVFNTVVMGFQIGLSTLLMFSLPLLENGADLRMTWRVHQQITISRIAFYASFFVSFIQIALIPLGIALVKNADSSCSMEPSLTYVYTFYISLFQCIFIVCMSAPICFMPCYIALCDVPSYHGLNPQAIRRLTTITYVVPDQQPPAVETETKKSSYDIIMELENPNLAELYQQQWYMDYKEDLRISKEVAEEVANERARASASSSQSTLNATTPNMPKTTTPAQQHKSKPKEIKKLSRHRRHETVRESECAICLEAWLNGEIIKKLNCGHAFHQDCVIPWLEEHVHCPLCRSSLERKGILRR